tara:strand:- start:695 stop:1051 length:357 start_codon:yes stop_codon:yes gene_type:complete
MPSIIKKLMAKATNPMISPRGRKRRLVLLRSRPSLARLSPSALKSNPLKRIRRMRPRGIIYFKEGGRPTQPLISRARAVRIPPANIRTHIDSLLKLEKDMTMKVCYFSIVPVFAENQV